MRTRGTATTPHRLQIQSKGPASRVSLSAFSMPLDWSPPSPWTDASGLSVDASGLVPPHQFWKGGTGGQPKNYYKMYNFVYTTLNNHEIT